MSTIASPRDPSIPFRRTHSSQNITTPTSSARPSIDAARSPTSSPVPSNPKRANRAALREYYNLKRATSPSATPVLEVTDPLGDTLPHSEIPASELDSPTFDAEAYVRNALQTSSLADLLRLYAKVMGEMRALDAEKKALVYDNYSKLIAATETIRRMRMNMDPLTPMASTLDPAIGRVYEMARGCREDVARVVDGDGHGGEGRRRTRDVVRTVLAVPGRLRELVAQNNLEEARREWDLPRRLLVSWREKGVGGGDVDEVIQEGDEVLRGAEDEGSGSGSDEA